MDPKDLLLVAIGGAIGACLRDLVTLWSPNGEFPIATLIVNLIGSFFLGAIFALSSNQFIDDKTMLLIATGILGSFTTMSTYSVETINLWEKDKIMSIFYIFLTAIICPLLALFGIELINSELIIKRN